MLTVAVIGTDIFRFPTATAVRTCYSFLLFLCILGVASSVGQRLGEVLRRNQVARQRCP